MNNVYIALKTRNTLCDILLELITSETMDVHIYYSTKKQFINKIIDDTKLVAR